MAIRKNKKQPINKRSRVKNTTITDLAHFDPKTTLVFNGNADFAYYPEIIDLGNLQKITGAAYFGESEVQDLGKLQMIGGDADFQDSQVQDLGNLQKIRGNADFENSQVQDLGKLQMIGDWANFSNSQVQDLGKLQTIGGSAYFENSQIQSLGNLQTIGDNAYFGESQVQSLGNLQTIGGIAYFQERTDLEADWEQRQESNNYAKGGGVGKDRYIVSFNYNPSIVKNDFAELLVSKYTKDWTHDNDLDEVSFYVKGLTKEEALELKKELEMEDVYNIEIERSKYTYAKGGGVEEETEKKHIQKQIDILIEEKRNALKQGNQGLANLKQFKINDLLEEKTKYAKGGGVGRKLDFESREYDMPRGKTIYVVEVEDPYDDGETIEEEYDNYDEAISAYERSEIRFTPTWRTYLETNKPPYVYESGIVLPNGTLKVLYRKGREVRYDWYGNEIP